MVAPDRARKKQSCLFVFKRVRYSGTQPRHTRPHLTTLSDKEFHRALPLDELPQGGMRACEVAGRPVLVCRTKDGVYALDDVCTHAFARMHEGRLRGWRLICPLHGASFDVRDGRVLGAPAIRPLPCHDARIVGDVVEVALDPNAPALVTGV
jgi:nitrite reductase/ring-hydroxylating ferredoxin subunit